MRDAEGRRLYDLHGHPMVDHDLYNLRGYLTDQLEQQLALASTEEQEQAARIAHDARLRFVPDRPGIADAFREWGRRQGFAFCSDEENE